MRTIFAALILLLTPHLCFPKDTWTKTDTAMQIVASGLIVSDWSQTRYRSRSWDTPEYEDGTIYYHRESNPILGDTPHTDNVDIYFASALVVTPIIAYYLSKPLRHLFQTGIITMELAVTGNNFSLGGRMRF